MERVRDVFQDRVVLDAAQVHGALGMVALLQGDAFPLIESVTLLEEALKEGTFRITETDEAGQVPFLKVTNDGAVPVLILDGEELVGGKQNRIVNTSILVPARTTLTIPVSCMEAGRWREVRRDFDAGGAVFRARSRSLHKESVAMSLREEGAYFSDQAAVWSEVDATLEELGTHSSTADFRAARARADERIVNYEAYLRPSPTQIGAVFYGPEGLLGCELLGSPELFAKAFSKILKSFAFEVAFAEGQASAHCPEAEPWWHHVLDAPVAAYPSPGEGTDLRLESDGLIGSALLWQDRIAHLSCFPKTMGASRNRWRREPRRASVSERRRNWNSRNSDP